MKNLMRRILSIVVAATLMIGLFEVAGAQEVLADRLPEGMKIVLGDQDFWYEFNDKGSYSTSNPERVGNWGKMYLSNESGKDVSVDSDYALGWDEVVSHGVPKDDFSLQITCDMVRKFEGKAVRMEYNAADHKVNFRNLSHMHSFQYSASGNTLQAKCSDYNCKMPMTYSLSLMIFGPMMYTGEPLEVQVMGVESWRNTVPGGVPEIIYYDRKTGNKTTSKNGAAKEGGAPVNPGLYVATMGVNEKATAKLEFDVPCEEHKWDDGVVTTEATCTEDGVKTYTCTLCGETTTEAIKAQGHKWDDGVVTKEATETAEGEKTYTCTVCKATKKEAIPKKSSGGEQGLKKGESAKNPKNANETITCISKNTASYKTADKKTTVKVPASVTIKDVKYSITTLNKDAFGANKVKSVNLPKSLKTIGSQAFKGDKKLAKITINSKKLSVNKNAFKGLKKSQLKKIKVIVNKKNMTKKDFTTLQKSLVKLGFAKKNIVRK